MPHFQLVVPNYDKTPSGDHPLTYVRLGQAWGANEALPVANRGDDLLTAHTNFKDDTRDAEGRTKPKTYYRDDGVTCSASSSSALSGELLTRGGIREHTDGDRISTTRGDYLGVVFGNYKLVIMGRVEGANVGRSYWESSGGHNHDSTSTPGEVSTISWTTSHEDNTWEVVEETVKGEQWAYYQGRKESTFYGPVKNSTVGATTPPTIKDVTYCQKKTAMEVHDTKVENTTVNGNVTEHTQVILQNRDALYFSGSGTVEDSTTATSVFSSHLLALPLITSQALFGAHYEKYGGDFTTKLTIGAEVGVTLGAATTFRFLHVAVPINVASTLEISLAGSLSLEIGVTGKIVCIHKMETGIDENEITLMDLRIKAAQKKVDALEIDVGIAEIMALGNLAQP